MLRIPELIDQFKEGERTYLVMEFIKFVTVSPSEMDNRVEAVLSWLSSVPPPDGHELGPLGGGCIQHRLVEQCRVYSIYYIGTLVLPDVRGEGERLGAGWSCWL